jgi:hypothetical protein
MAGALALYNTPHARSGYEPQDGLAPKGASDAMHANPFAADPTNALLQVLRLAQLAAAMPDASQPAAPQHFIPPAPSGAGHPFQAFARMGPTSPPVATTSGTSSDRQARHQANAAVEHEASIAGLKVCLCYRVCRRVLACGQFEAHQPCVKHSNSACGADKQTGIDCCRVCAPL